MKINVLAVSVAPIKPDGQTIRIKEEIVEKVFVSFKERFEEECQRGRTKLICFRPGGGDTFTNYSELIVELFSSEPCIVIYNSLADISQLPSTAFNRLRYFMSLSNVKAVYLTDYSITMPVGEYLGNLASIFDIQYDKRRKPRKSPYHIIIEECVCKLHDQRSPVRYEDISKVTGISVNSLKALVNKRGGGWGRLGTENGRPITPEEVEFLKKAKADTQAKIEGSVYVWINHEFDSYPNK